MRYNRYNFNMIIMMVVIVIVMNMVLFADNYTVEEDEEEYIEEDFYNNSGINDSLLTIQANIQNISFISYLGSNTEV